MPVIIGSALGNAVREYLKCFSSRTTDLMKNYIKIRQMITNADIDIPEWDEFIKNRSHQRERNKKYSKIFCNKTIHVLFCNTCTVLVCFQCHRLSSFIHSPRTVCGPVHRQLKTTRTRKIFTLTLYGLNS